jgi:predicted TPR repeat methyltransferase
MARSAVSQTLFDVWSRVYDLPVVQRLIYRVDHDVVVGRLEGAPGTVVDLGCGTGLLTARLAERWPGATVVGCDFSRGMLAEAADRSSGARWVQAGRAGQRPSPAPRRRHGSGPHHR